MQSDSTLAAMDNPAQFNVLKMARIACAFLLAGFSLYTAFFGIMSDMIQRSVHLGLVLVLVYLGALVPSSLGLISNRTLRILSVMLAVIGLATMMYQVWFFDEIASRYGELTQIEFYIGLVATLILLEATRRTIGWPIVILAIIFLLYAYFGYLLPGLANHRGYDLERIMSQLYLGGGGIFGTPLGVSSTFVILIVLFGAALETSGAGKVLMDIATSLTGRSRGGPAKAAVVGSSLMGMVSGTAVANVLTTGTISIPLMKRTGYRPEVAGAIEAVASTGGQLMPPVMGATAFLMADLTGISYFEIARAAIIPALLYYVVLFSVVHLEAVKQGIALLKLEELPSLSKTLKTGSHLLLSLPVFVYMLFSGYSVMYASFWAFIAAILLSYVRRSTWLTPKKLYQTIINGVEAVLPVATACACAGIIIGVITLTGLGLKFSSLVISLSDGNLFLALILTMIASLILGMGLPTAAAYILVATLAAPALEQLGVNQLAAHLFVFYSAMLSSITPPVALAAYAAAGLAQANPFRIALVACQFGCAAFIVPYFFAYNPALLMVDTTPGVVIIAALTTVVGGICLAITIQGWCINSLNVLERIAFAAVVWLLLDTSLTTDIAGIILLAALASHQFVAHSKRTKQPQQLQ
ncbi:MAG: TRAP transporter 4TM/12TM fusion protein [Porticoccaceae bacterium]|jgi:TRAP transporter 4TM/12TM fusion protein